MRTENDCDFMIQTQPPKMFYKKGFLKISQNSQESTYVRVSCLISYLCQSLFVNKVADLRPATLLKETLAQVFSCGFFEISQKISSGCF